MPGTKFQGLLRDFIVLQQPFFCFSHVHKITDTPNDNAISSTGWRIPGKEASSQ